ncbi:MAG TPA: ester cyclase [Longimicrobiaceae bacterium]|nr:ester cyclase [Longimicrobiaceae bacterium]
MTTQEITALAHGIYDAFNRRDFAYTAAASTDDVEVLNVPTGQVFRGKEELIGFLQSWATAFPDGTIEVANVIAGENGAAAEFIARGTQTGPLVGPMGTIPPTGRAVEVRFIDAWEMRGDKIARGRTYYDLMTMLGQLGVLGVPAEAGAS